MKQINQTDLKILTVPLGILLAVLLVGFISTKLLLDNVFRLTNDNSISHTTENSLQTKLNSLQTINTQISNQSELSVLALPSSNAVLSVISNIKNQGTELGLLLSNLRSSDDTIDPGNTLIQTQIDFETDGSFSNIGVFIKKLTNSAPITRFDRIKVINQGGSNLYRLSANLISYWSPLPTKLPSIEEPLTSLTSDEEKILSQISLLEQPSFTSSGLSGQPSLLPQSNPEARPDPFSL